MNIGPKTTYGSTSKGLRLVGSVNPGAGSDIQAVRDFSISVNGNWEDAHYKDFVGCFIFKDINQVTAVRQPSMAYSSLVCRSCRFA